MQLELDFGVLKNWEVLTQIFYGGETKYLIKQGNNEYWTNDLSIPDKKFKNLSQLYTKKLRLIEDNPNRDLENWDYMIEKIKNNEPLI